LVLQTGKTYYFGLLAKFNKNIDNVLFGFEMENTKGVKLFLLIIFEVLPHVQTGDSVKESRGQPQMDALQ
jgi:hypothetical protein